MLIISIIGFSFNVIMGIVLDKSGVPHSHGLNKKYVQAHYNDDHEPEHEHDHSLEEIALYEEAENEKKKLMTK